MPASSSTTNLTPIREVDKFALEHDLRDIAHDDGRFRGLQNCNLVRRLFSLVRSQAAREIHAIYTNYSKIELIEPFAELEDWVAVGIVDRNDP